MKKSILSIAIVAAASQAFAASQVVNFNWVNVNLNGPAPIQVSTIAPFNAALGTLVGVNINVSGVSVAASSTVNNTETFPITASQSINGTHSIAINGLANINTALAGFSAPVNIPAGGTSPVGPVSAALSGGGAASPAANANWSVNVPVFISFVGQAGVNVDPASARIVADGTIISNGVGTVEYVYRDNLVPEAETYVAGLAMAGLVGYGFFRRSRKA